MSWQRLGEQRLRREVGEILAEAERVDKEEDARWGEKRGDGLSRRGPPRGMNRRIRVRERLHPVGAGLDPHRESDVPGRLPGSSGMRPG